MKKKTVVLTVYVLLFYSLWAFFELAGQDMLSLPSDALGQLLTNGVIKNLVWTLPAALLIYCFRGEVNVTLKEMFTTKIRWRTFLPVFLFFTVYLLGGAVLQKGTLAISENFGMKQIVILLFVGFTEEMVFRGWLLNAGNWEEKRWLNLLVNAGLFLAIHFPIWLREGIFFSSFGDLGFLCVIALSLIFGWSFMKNRNILVPIFLHMYWDLLMFLLY